MGYYTSHTLTMKKGSYDLIEQFVNENESAKFAMSENGDCREPCKWYDHETDMRAFSKNTQTQYLSSAEKGKSPEIFGKNIIRMGKCKDAKL